MPDRRKSKRKWILPYIVLLCSDLLKRSIVYQLTINGRRIHGIEFSVNTALMRNTQGSPIALDERLMALRLLHAKNSLATFVSDHSSGNGCALWGRFSSCTGQGLGCSRCAVVPS